MPGHRENGLSGSSDAAERGRGRRPRPVGIAIIAFVLLILAIAIGAIALQEPTDDEIVIQGAPEVQRQIGGLRQIGDRLGSADAPVTVEVFNDMQCPSCRRWQLEVVPRLIEGSVRRGLASLVFRHFSQSQRGTTVGAVAAEAAGAQGRQWQYIQLFFLNQREAADIGVTEEFLRRIARSSAVTFDIESWEKLRRRPATLELVEEDAGLAEMRRLPVGPAVVVDGPRGTRELTESPPLAKILAAIESVGGNQRGSRGAGI